MKDYPRTLEEAKETKYGSWAGSPNGRPYNEGRCAYDVWGDRAWYPRQCCRKNGHGINELYCKQHASKVVVQL